MRSLRCSGNLAPGATTLEAGLRPLVQRTFAPARPVFARARLSSCLRRFGAFNSPVEPGFRLRPSDFRDRAPRRGAKSQLCHSSRQTAFMRHRTKAAAIPGTHRRPRSVERPFRACFLVLSRRRAKSRNQRHVASHLRVCRNYLALNCPGEMAVRLPSRLLHSVDCPSSPTDSLPEQQEPSSWHRRL